MAKTEQKKTLKVRTGVKAGGAEDQHNEPALKVRTGIKAGGGGNWNG